jgi:CBS-domain-containing membrane protein
MKCSDLMNMNVQWVHAEVSVAEAARIMRDRSMGFLLVWDAEFRRLVGVVTDRDIAVRCCAENKRPDEVTVADIASTDVVTCGHEESLKVAEQKMIEWQKSRLVIVDEIGQVIGILSLTDILQRDHVWRAVQTARGVLARESEGPHVPIESIKLTPSTPEEEELAARHHSSLHGGSWDTTVKLFP